jgi:hypothetical protein
VWTLQEADESHAAQAGAAVMYRMPKNLDPRITEEFYQDLMEIASMECETFMSFGSPQDRFERAVLSAARKTLELVDAQTNG